MPSSSGRAAPSRSHPLPRERCRQCDARRGRRTKPVGKAELHGLLVGDDGNSTQPRRPDDRHRHEAAGGEDDRRTQAGQEPKALAEARQHPEQVGRVAPRQQAIPAARAAQLSGTDRVVSNARGGSEPALDAALAADVRDIDPVGLAQSVDGRKRRHGMTSAAAARHDHTRDVLLSLDIPQAPAAGHCEAQTYRSILFRCGLPLPETGWLPGRPPQQSLPTRSYSQR